MTPEQQAQQAEDLKLFGRVLRRMRTTFAGKMNLPDGVVVPELSERKVIKCLTEHGQPISSGAYSSWENGDSLPRDPEIALKAFNACFGLDEEDPTAILLRQTLSLGVGISRVEKFGSPFDEIIPEDFKADLRRRVREYVGPQPQSPQGN